MRTMRVRTILILVCLGSAANLGGDGFCGASGTPVYNPFTRHLDCTAAAGVGSGTVTSVGLAGTSRQITVTGSSPITGSGSWTLSFPANLLLPLATGFTASTTSGAAFNLPSGVAPTSPASGDFWNASGALRFYDGSAIRTLSFMDDAGTGTTSTCFQLDNDSTGPKLCHDAAGGFVVKKSDDTVLATIDVNGVLTLGDGTAPWNLTGITDDVAPSAPGSANQFTTFMDRTTGLFSWILNGGTQKYVALGDSNGAATLAPTEAYDATNWDNDTAPPQKDAVRDKIETLAPKADPVFTGSLQLPNGASPTVDAAGEIAVDTTTDQLQVYGAAKRAIPTLQFISFVIPAPADTDDVNLMKAPYGMTIVGIDAIVQGTTSVTGQLQECDSTGASCTDLDSDIVADADGAADDGSLTDSSIASGAWLRWKTTSVSGTPTFLTVTVKFRVVAD